MRTSGCYYQRLGAVGPVDEARTRRSDSGYCIKKATSRRREGEEDVNVVSFDETGRQYWFITLIPQGLGYWQLPVNSVLPYVK